MDAGSRPAWLHEAISREESEARTASSPGGIKEGKFMLRPKLPEQNQFVLLVVYHGKCTHHLVKQEGDKVTINNKHYGEARTLQDLVSTLSRPTQGWPVLLTEPVLAPSSPTQAPVPVPAAASNPSAQRGLGTLSEESEVEPPLVQTAQLPQSPTRPDAQPQQLQEQQSQLSQPQRRSSVEISESAAKHGQMQLWLHELITREEAEARIASTPGGLVDGRFFLRPRPNFPSDFAMVVVYKGKCTHHLVTKSESGVYAVNKTSFGNFTTVEGLINQLMQPTPGWPVVLHDPIPSPFAGREVEEAATKIQAAWRGRKVRQSLDMTNAAVQQQVSLSAPASAAPAPASDDEPIEEEAVAEPAPPRPAPRQQMPLPEVPASAAPRSQHYAGRPPAPLPANADADASSPAQQASRFVPSLLSTAKDESHPGTPLPVSSPMHAIWRDARRRLEEETVNIDSLLADRDSQPGSSPTHRFMQDAPSLSRWKCGECGYDNAIVTTEDATGTRTCKTCGKQRAAQQMPTEQAILVSPLVVEDPERIAAKENLGAYVKLLPPHSQLKFRDALQLFVERKWSLLNLVTAMSLILRTADSSMREKLEHTVRHLIPRAAGAKYDLLLLRARKEEHIDLLVSQGTAREYEILGKLVMRGLHMYRGDTLHLDQVSPFERRVHLASTQRGWAVCRWQCDDPTLEHFDIELVAKEIHIGWARTVVAEWDADAYGPRPQEQVIRNFDGHLDSYNFLSAEGHKVYQKRLSLARLQYLFPGQEPEDDEATLTEEQKTGYRIAAEILLDAFRLKYPEATESRFVQRFDRILHAELTAKGVLKTGATDASIRSPQSLAAGVGAPGQGQAGRRLNYPRAGPPTYDEEIRTGGVGMATGGFGFSS